MLLLDLRCETEAARLFDKSNLSDNFPLLALCSVEGDAGLGNAGVGCCEVFEVRQPSFGKVLLVVGERLGRPYPWPL